MPAVKHCSSSSESGTTCCESIDGHLCIDGNVCCCPDQMSYCSNGTSCSCSGECQECNASVNASRVVERASITDHHPVQMNAHREERVVPSIMAILRAANTQMRHVVVLVMHAALLGQFAILLSRRVSAPRIPPNVNIV